MAEANNHLYSGYGSDELSDQAKAKIREACGQPTRMWVPRRRHADQIQVVIDTITPAYAGVVAVASGHPNVHEAGAIEFSPHKVLHDSPSTTAKWTRPNWTSSARPSMDGNYEHMVFLAPCTSRKAPNMAPSTQGRVAGHRRCGAKVRHAAVRGRSATRLRADHHRLRHDASRISSTIADVFYIGGTKVGCPVRRGRGVYQAQQRRSTLTPHQAARCLAGQGLWLGAQFDALFTDNLYFKIARNANEAADRLREALRSKGYTPSKRPPTRFS